MTLNQSFLLLSMIETRRLHKCNGKGRVPLLFEQEHDSETKNSY